MLISLYKIKYENSVGQNNTRAEIINGFVFFIIIYQKTIASSFYLFLLRFLYRIGLGLKSTELE